MVPCTLPPLSSIERVTGGPVSVFHTPSSSEGFFNCGTFGTSGGFAVAAPAIIRSSTRPVDRAILISLSLKDLQLFWRRQILVAVSAEPRPKTQPAGLCRL